MEKIIGSILPVSYIINLTTQCNKFNIKNNATLQMQLYFQLLFGTKKAKELL